MVLSTRSAGGSETVVNEFRSVDDRLIATLCVPFLVVAAWDNRGPDRSRLSYPATVSVGERSSGSLSHWTAYRGQSLFPHASPYASRCEVFRTNQKTAEEIVNGVMAAGSDLPLDSSPQSDTGGSRHVARCGAFMSAHGMVAWCVDLTRRRVHTVDFAW